MRFLIGSLTAICFVIAYADGADRLDLVYSDWERAQRDIQSLVVEFTQEVPDRVFNTTQKREGVFRLVRTPTGEIHASYELNPEKTGSAKSERFVGKLNGRTVTLLDSNQKIETRLKIAEKDLLGVLEDYFNPLVVLLDRRRAEENCNLEIKLDENYTYLSVSPKQVKQSGWFGLPMSFKQGRVVLMNKDSKNVPKGMPRQLSFTTGYNEIIFEIKTWRMNAADGPKVEDFTRPDDRPGWKLEEVDWPLKSPKAQIKE